ncbi:MAG: succinyl-CoA synthetase subunit alpha [Syntrophorhabdaceae bacterium PtaU1.Bin034]|nr:MAG: succinyl-CoA synthetase subunit alpha [Syntrophorhabdaceae bacterium PtaU1.Bin034]
MHTFFYPDSIAVFGVSDRPSNLAGRIIGNLSRFGFQGKVYPVGKHNGTVAGRRIYTSLDQVESVPDLAVLLIPAHQVAAALEECGRKGIRRVIIESGGFSELDDENRTTEDELAEIASKWGITFIGPNCFGVLNMENGVVLPFFVLDPGYMKAGPVSLISQSGGIFYDACMICSCENIGLNKLVSIGNKLRLKENDFLEYLLTDRGTKVIGVYLEDFSDGRRLMELASSTDKPVILLKANRGERSREIAKFHTTALAGDDLIADAAMKQAGIHRVRNLREMMECFKIFSLPLLKGPRLALVTRSGGHGVLSADAVERHGFTLAGLPDNIFEAVRSKKANVIRTTNPLDVGDIYDMSAYSGILEMMLREQGVDGVVFIVTYSSESDGDHIEEFVRQAARMSPRYQKPVVLCMVSNREQWFSMKTAGDIPTFLDIDDALHALARSYSHYCRRTRQIAEAARKPAFIKKARPGSGARHIMGPDETFTLLRRYDLPVAEYAVVHTVADALNVARLMGYPVALKTASPQIIHKTEHGAVILGVDGPEALARAFGNMDSTTCLIQKMVQPGIEMIVGGKYDMEFGPVVLLGFGGIYVELLKNTSIRVAPAGLETAREMIDGLEGSAILRGFRGRPPADTESLGRILVSVSRLLIDNPSVTSLDLNPVIVGEQGKGCLVVDAKVEVQH